MKQPPRLHQMGDIPQNIRPETVTDPYGVDGGGYNTQQVYETDERIRAMRAEERARAVDIGPARNVAVRGRFAQSAFAANGTSLQILNVNPRRLYLLIQNLGPNDVYVNFGNKAQVNNVKIIVNGNYEPFVTPLDSINVICDPGNTAALAVVEGVEVKPGGY